MGVRLLALAESLAGRTTVHLAEPRYRQPALSPRHWSTRAVRSAGPRRALSRNRMAFK